MATRRTVLAKTKLFAKGRGSGAGTDLKRYLKRYVDDVAKSLAKYGEFPARPQGGEEKRNLLPEETQGRLHSGGFIGKGSSPGSTQANKQRGWINRSIDKWVAELRSKNRRTNDGFRFVLSMAPRAVADITESKQSSTQALLAIWDKTVELYRIRHGWEKPADELAWICGAHTDTDNAHIHIMLFPTTKSGKPIKTNNNGKKRGMDLNDFSAMANIAAEIYWREKLGLAYQDPEYLIAISNAPNQEPPLPPYEAFDGGKATIEPRDKKRPEVPKINTSLIAKEMIPDIMLGINNGLPVKKAKRKGITRLKSLVAAVAVFKSSDWLIKTLMGKSTAAKEKEVEEKFPDENQILKSVAEELKTSDHLPTRRLGEKIASGGDEALHATLHLALGTQDEPDNSTATQTGIKLANDFQTSLVKVSVDKLHVPWNSRAALKTLSMHTKVRLQTYRNALRAWMRKTQDPESRVSQTLSAMITGAERSAHVMDSVKDTIEHGIQPSGSTLKHNIQDNEWAIENSQMVRKKTKGMPWPLHFDPATVFETMRRPDPQEIEPEPKKKALDKKDPLEIPRPDGGGVIKRIVRIIQPKELERRRMERNIGKSDPDLN